ncbi:unnamed protein product [Arctogadus glacialis]
MHHGSSAPETADPGLRHEQESLFSRSSRVSDRLSLWKDLLLLQAAASQRLQDPEECPVAKTRRMRREGTRSRLTVLPVMERQASAHGESDTMLLLFSFFCPNEDREHKLGDSSIPPPTLHELGG